MKIAYRVLLMVFLFPLVLFAAEESQEIAPRVTPDVKPQENAPQVTPEALAIASTEQWLKIIDADNYDKGWIYAAESLKNAVPKGSFKQTLQKLRSPLGSLKNRVLAGSKYTTPPDGEFVVIKYKTEFANKAGAVETLISKKEDGQWKVYGYYIK